MNDDNETGLNKLLDSVKVLNYENALEQSKAINLEKKIEINIY